MDRLDERTKRKGVEMTRASHSAAPIVRMSRKTGSGGACPQWMRTLEEKYQKLHKKITENTLPANAKFTQDTGRSVYDVRFSHALAKSREIIASRSFVNLKKRNAEIEGTLITSKSDPTLCDETDEIQNDDDKYLYNEELNGVCNNSVEDCKLNTLVENRQGKNEQCVIDTNCFTLGDCDTAVEGDENRALDEGNLLKTEMLTTESPDDDEGECTAMDTKYQEEMANDFNQRNVKTSMSRSSKVTSKSCPAQIQSPSTRSNDRVQRTPLNRSKSTHKNGKTIAQMSEEAKHAITETIQEMRISTPTKSRTSMMEFVPSRNRKCVKSWNIPRKSGIKAKSAYDPRTVLESASARLQTLETDVPVNNDALSVSRSDRENDSILPEIQNDSKEKIPLPLFSYRLLGIGKYDIANQDTFEITPPGFDSRYNDVQPVEERESETPPLDIRQQAIEKCSEWLVKHNVK